MKKRAIFLALAVISMGWLGWAVLNAGSEPVTGVWVMMPADYDPPEIPAEFGLPSKLSGVLYPDRMEFRKDGTWLWRRENRSWSATGKWRRCPGVNPDRSLTYECELDGEIVAWIECTLTRADFSRPPRSPWLEHFPMRYVRPGSDLTEIPGRLWHWIEGMIR